MGLPELPGECGLKPSTSLVPATSIPQPNLLLRLGRIRRFGTGSVRSVSRRAAWALGRVLPLSARQTLVAFVGRQKLPAPLRFEFAMGMLTDLRRRDPVALHRFLWANHLAYAASYEVPHRFGASKINPTRHVLFDGMAAHLRSRGIDPGTDIRSVLEIGCSQGYLLRHLETTLFRSATTLHGLDLDAHAIKTGSDHLDSLGSRVRLFAADMEAAESIIGNQAYDVVLCCGVLMYVNESIAEKVVRLMFARAARLIGLICLAPPQGKRGRHGVRASDGAFIHDLDPLIRKAGGNVLSSCLIGTPISGSSPSHVIVAEPKRRTAPSRTVDPAS
jgi:SAM-dependent methyltransferase